MHILFNDQKVELKGNLTLRQVLHENKLADKKGIAVAVNTIVVSRKDWDTYILKDKDTVLVITAVQGG